MEPFSTGAITGAGLVLVLGTVAYLGGRASKPDMKPEELMRETAGLVREQNAPEMAELEGRLAAAEADRKVVCDDSKKGLTCLVDVQQEACDESISGAQLTTECANAIRAIRLFIAEEQCSTRAKERADWFTDGERAAFEHCMKSLTPS